MGRPPKKSAAAKPSLSESWTETQALLKDVGALSEKVCLKKANLIHLGLLLQYAPQPLTAT